MNYKRILLAANIVLTFLILWTASTIVMAWTSKERAVETVKDRDLGLEGKGPKAPGESRPMSDFQALVQQDIFRTTGQRPEAGPARVVEEKPVEVTKLNLKLKGIVIRSGNSSFAAIMDGATRKEEIYYLNDTVQNARIAKILRDQVILEVNNRQEALLLFTRRDQTERGSAPGPAAARRFRPPPALRSFPPPDPSRSALGAAAARRLPAMIRQKRR